MSMRLFYSWKAEEILNLGKLHDAGMTTVSLTSDGPSCNQKMMDALGANLDPDNLKPYFMHPIEKDQKVYVLLDICHALKLVRNAFASGAMIKDSEGNTISWEYIKELHKLQTESGLRAGNKLSKRHIQWYSNKMKVAFRDQSET